MTSLHQCSQAIKKKEKNVEKFEPYICMHFQNCNNFKYVKSAEKNK